VGGVEREANSRIVEVSPRDGLQNLPPPAIPTKTKLGLIERLLHAGVRNVEVGSFVRGDWVPQMADSSTLLPQLPLASAIPIPHPPASPHELSGIPPHSGIRLTGEEGKAWYPVLVPNMRGLDNLLTLEEEHRAKGRTEKLTEEIAVFVSATEVCCFYSLTRKS
jgi:hydroxymethylglutaryl-CoA lyase